MHLGLTQKIFGGYLVLIVALFAIGGYGGYTIYSLTGDYRRLAAEGVPAQRTLDSLTEVFRLQTGNEKKFYVVPNLAFAELFSGQNTEWTEAASALKERFADTPVAMAIDVLMAQHQVYARLVEDNMAKGGKVHDTAALIDMISVGLDDLSLAIQTRQDAMMAATAERGDRVVGVTMALGLVTVILGLAAAYGLSRLLTRPVRRLRRATEEVARGIFDRKVPAYSQDEIGDLAASFNHMADKLQALDELRDEFVAYVSHELKTPLTSLKEATALLRDGVAGPVTERQRKLLGIIEEDGAKLEKLIAEMLDLSKMEAGMMPFNKETTPFGGIASQAVTEMEPVAEKRQVMLRIVPDGLAMVEADPSRVRQVITNLISNAIKFSPQRSEVAVGWSIASDQTGDTVICSVSDHGPGIPADAREIIFEKFHQLAPSALSGMRGTGLGLPISRKIVEAHGGRLWVECPRGGGSVFRFSLPLRKPENALRTTQQVA